MTQQFASIELARLYESQGYLADALSMYKELDEEAQGDGTEIKAAINRLEAAVAEQSEPASPSPEGEFEKTIAELSGSDPKIGHEPDRESESGKGSETEPQPVSNFVSAIKTDREKRIARLLDKWLMLMVVQKRVKLFKAIRARL